jgi:prepilin-type N-terminal cleavage/methylation domain-containing protein
MGIKLKKGFTLLEIMVSLALGLVVIGMVLQLFINTKQNHAQNEQVTSALENGRYALRTISNDLKGVGFMGGMWDMSLLDQDVTLSLATDCGQAAEANWAYDLSTYNSIQFLYNVDGATASAQFQCINGGELQNSTDVLAVKRTYTEKDTGALSDGVVYLRTDYNGGCLWFKTSTNTGPGGGGCPAAGFEDWRYMSNIYYIRSYADTPGDGTPTLCKKFLTTTAGGIPQPTMGEVCLAEGVEHIHVQFGLDTDTPKDGVANKYVSNPTAAEVSTKAVAAKVFILVRATREDPNFTNTKTYTLGDRVVNVNDNFYRRVYSTTVVLRNPKHTAIFNEF